jgi:LmbE family N-acetylglucosaminyl deacetylase
MMMNDEKSGPPFLNYTPQTVLVVGAHADDIDVTAGGSVALWTKAGAHVEYLILTDGSKGSADDKMTATQLTATRQAEQQAAAEILGAHDVHFLNYEDGMLEVTMDLKRDIVRVIREVRPDTVVVMDPTMVYAEGLNYINHPDHRAAGQATLDAVFPLARDHLSFPELLDQAHLGPHKVAHVLLTNFAKQNCWVDISTTFDLKLKALLRHASQMPDPERVSSMLRRRAESAGSQAGCKYAEGFVRIDTMG